MSTVTLQFLGAAGTVTGSKYLLEFDGQRVLVDAGLYQGEKELRRRNWDGLPIDPSTIDYVILTHAHADHVSYLPALVKRGFDGPVYCTLATLRLAEIVLRDAAYLQELATAEAIQGGWSKHEDPQPLYTTEDAEAAIRMLRVVEFDENIDLGDPVWACWTRAGHILGSASVRLDIGEVSVLFSGDLGRDAHPLLKPRDTPEGAEWVICESTYGDREHDEPAVSHAELADAVTRTIARGGTVLIPAFAIDRTQAVMYEITRLMRAGRIPEVPVVVDGPMSMRALDVYRDMPNEFRDDVDHQDFLGVGNFVEARSGKDHKKALHRADPRIVISSSGMLEGGRVLSYLSRLLPDERNTVVMSGYQGEGTRGRGLLDGAKHIKIKGRHVPVRAEVTIDREFSAHADASEIAAWVGALDPKPRTVFLTHGEAEPAETLMRRLRDELGLDVVIPIHGEKVLLSEQPPVEEDEIIDVPDAMGDEPA